MLRKHAAVATDSRPTGRDSFFGVLGNQSRWEQGWMLQDEDEKESENNKTEGERDVGQRSPPGNVSLGVLHLSSGALKLKPQIA